ncbi:uridine kinase family protein [Rubrivivax gelatinosus]|uniref:uridine kinase family protein n=1 Tax=Rubrivivax gelatinosus TaxID=28068 RepID=UPI003A80ECA1
MPQTLATQVHTSMGGRNTPFIVALCGWADTGKSTVATQLVAALRQFGLAADAISTDDFMRDRAERDAVGISGYDLRSIDMAALRAALVRFFARQPFGVHRYDNRTGMKSGEPRTVSPADVLVVEGIHALHPDLSPHTHLKVFIDAEEATARELRVRANQRKRGMSAHDAAARVEREWRDYCAWVLPRRERADIVVQVDLEFGYRGVNSGTSDGVAGKASGE